jgi:hypothetical protein
VNPGKTCSLVDFVASGSSSDSACVGAGVFAIIVC